MLCMYVTVCVKYANKFNFKKKLSGPVTCGTLTWYLNNFKRIFFVVFPYEIE